MSDALFWLVAGYMFAPLLLLPLVAAASFWRWLSPPKASIPFSYNDPVPPDPPPPLTDEKFNRMMAQARLMRQKAKRGLV